MLMEWTSMPMGWAYMSMGRASMSVSMPMPMPMSMSVSMPVPMSMSVRWASVRHAASGSRWEVGTQNEGPFIMMDGVRLPSGCKAAVTRVLEVWKLGDGIDVVEKRRAKNSCCMYSN